VRAFRRNPRLGYSSGFHGLLTQVTNGTELIAALRPASKGAGSAMRACPIGVLPTLDDVLRIAEIQARITHDTPEGVAAAQGVAAMTHFGVVSGPDALRGLRRRLRDLDPILDAALTRKHTGPVPNEGLPALNAALGVIEVAQTQKDAAILAVDYGGDVDTVAAVAMGVLSLMLPESARKLPRELVHRSASGPYGLGYIQSLDAELAERMAITRTRSKVAAKL
jgi:ADP-ribosyl-[dinitrogen reductase] hydrolase